MRMLRPRDRLDEIKARRGASKKKASAWDATAEARREQLARLHENPAATFADRVAMSTQVEEAVFNAEQIRAEDGALALEQADLERVERAEKRKQKRRAAIIKFGEIATAHQHLRRLFGEGLAAVNDLAEHGFNDVVAELPMLIPLVMSMANANAPSFNGLAPFPELDRFEFRCRALRASLQS